ncbi:MAG: hypothetical protein NZ841_07390 [Dictyoglomus sp.]|nr:hypothetical protein [Dictyoglomus sp.]MDW8189101.1 hypothetical protein [Dictyoglomus sp.]
MEKTEDMISSKVEFSDFAKKDLDELKNLVFKNMKNAFEMIRESHVSRLKEAINKHIERMKKELEIIL